MFVQKLIRGNDHLIGLLTKALTHRRHVNIQQPFDLIKMLFNMPFKLLNTPKVLVDHESLLALKTTPDSTRIVSPSNQLLDLDIRHLELFDSLDRPVQPNQVRFASLLFDEHQRWSRVKGLIHKKWLPRYWADLERVLQQQFEVTDPLQIEK